MDEIHECEYCNADLHLGMNWWFADMAVCNDCHNANLSDPAYLARLDAADAS